MNNGYMGKCYYCKQDVIHKEPHDVIAFTKKFDKKTQSYKYSDAAHMDCYVKKMNEMLKIMSGVKTEEYRQLSLFD